MSFILYRDYIRLYWPSSLGVILGKWKDVLLTQQYNATGCERYSHDEQGCLGKKHHVMFVGNMKCIDWEKSWSHKWFDVLHCVTVMLLYVGTVCHMPLGSVHVFFLYEKYVRHVLSCLLDQIREMPGIYRSLFGTSQTCWLMVEVVQMRSSDHQTLWNNPKFYDGPMIGIAKYKHAS